MSRPAQTSAALIAAIAALGAAALAAPAQAQTFTPAPTTTTFSGPVVLSSPSLPCTLSVTVSVNASGAATVPSRAFSGAPVCTLVVPSGVWTLAAGPGVNQVTLGLEYQTIAHRCRGTVTLPFTAGSGAQIAFNTVTLPSIPAGGPCTLKGQIVSGTPLGIVP